MNIPTGSRIYLDANIFIYAAEAPNAFPKVMLLLKRLDQGEVVAITSALTLAEVLISPIRTGNIALESAYRNRLSTGSTLTVADITSDILLRAAAIRAATSSVKLPDAIHASTCQITTCDAFLTNDAGIKAIVGLPVIMLSDLA